MDIARITDEANSRLTLQHAVVQDYAARGSGTSLLFEGRGLPVGARSGALAQKVWQIEAVFPASRHDDVNALLSLLDEAYNAVDARLVITPQRGSESRLSPRTVVEVYEWNVARQAGGVVRISFTAEEREG